MIARRDQAVERFDKNAAPQNCSGSTQVDKEFDLATESCAVFDMAFSNVNAAIALRSTH